MTADLTWQAFAEAIPDLVLLTDRAGIIVYASHAAQNLGYAPSDLIGRRAASFVHADDLGAFRAHTAALFSTRAVSARTRREHRFRNSDGDWVWLRGNPSILPTAQGRPIQVLNILRDVTREVTTAQAGRHRLQDALDQAQQAAIAKAAFLSNMSHEIRTPLTAVLGFADLLAQRDNLDDAAGRYVSRIGGAGRALLAIVNDVLDFGKLDAGRMTVDPRPASALTAAREVLDVFALQAAGKGLELRFEATCGVPDHVNIDADRLRQILVNLVSNAVKFTTRGGASLRLDYDERSATLVAEVMDTGPGIAADQRRRLFQQFTQGDSSSTRAAGGTGLGLAISSGLAGAMGGRLSVRSRAGRGAVFRLEVPAPAVTAAAAPQPDAAPDAFFGLRVLVVDDNANNRELARAILEQAGVAVTEAGDGQEALRLAASLPFDAILMDLRMPGLDGRATLAAIRGRPGPNQDMPILAFSADNIGQASDMANLDEFQGRVIKPIQPAALLAAIGLAVIADIASVAEDLDAAAA